MTYAGRGRPESARTVHPLGLVVKGSLWYLVAGTDDGQRTFRVDRVRSVEPTDAPVDRPKDFDLSETWKSVVATVDVQRAPYKATVRVDPDVTGWLRRVWGTRVHFGRTLPDGRVEAELRGYSAFQVAVELAGFGSRVEVVSPDEVRSRLAELGAELSAFYA
jgi:predicted DNA-binding transcriptional regulator YafY